MATQRHPVRSSLYRVPPIQPRPPMSGPPQPSRKEAVSAQVSNELYRQLMVLAVE